MITRSRGRWTATTILTTTLLALTMTLGAAMPASASPADHGRDPSVGYGGAAPCNSNASRIGSRPVENEYGQTVATVDIYYSYSCQTNWIRVSGNPAGGNTVKDIRTAGGSWLPTEIDYGSGSSYSMQVYAPGTSCINFQVHLYYPSGASYGETYNAGSTYQTVC
ncbi:Protein of unknown function [Agreia bicolorata]|uniref:DUF2690 domain-containing protein n=1 Tax=Agreia bicolorata TaxID=110935 RepID=A0A1T4YNB8_9MICO|nr:DUF2690 domain-containing protein [Agreia bicolorata]SKB03262.1 Protein of unknown function [Agreia bicolorata]